MHINNRFRPNKVWALVEAKTFLVVRPLTIGLTPFRELQTTCAGSGYQTLVAVISASNPVD